MGSSVWQSLSWLKLWFIILLCAHQEILRAQIDLDTKRRVSNTLRQRQQAVHYKTVGISTQQTKWDVLNYVCRSITSIPSSLNSIFKLFRESVGGFTKPHVHTDIQPGDLILSSDFDEQPLKHQETRLSCRYLLTNTGNIRRRTFFAYNTRNRFGAEKETNNLRQHLEALGFDITKALVDFSAEELLEELERFCQKNAKITSILVVVILSHGSWGRVHDKDDRWIDINEIQEHLTLLPRNIPKILIIQACQSGSVQEHCKCVNIDGGPPRGRLGSSDIHIQDLDMAILMSTLWGQMSTRNFFIPILCEVLKDAAIEPLEITDIFRRVCSIMTQRNRRNVSSTALDHKRVMERTFERTSSIETNAENHQHEAPPNLRLPEDTGFEDTGFEDKFIQIPCMLSTLRKKLFFDRFSSDSAIF